MPLVLGSLGARFKQVKYTSIEKVLIRNTVKSIPLKGKGGRGNR